VHAAPAKHARIHHHRQLVRGCRPRCCCRRCRCCCLAWCGATAAAASASSSCCCAATAAAALELPELNVVLAIRHQPASASSIECEPLQLSLVHRMSGPGPHTPGYLTWWVLLPAGAEGR
jgi:hypothetical protein